jgi:aralkylamine N-acetyltransferase
LCLAFQVGFPRRKPEKLQLALQNTHVVLWVRATKQTRWARRGQLLGFARATSDHALFGTIWDVAVRRQQHRLHQCIDPASARSLIHVGALRLSCMWLKTAHDGVLHADIPQVNPAWQRSGIGRAAVERLTSMLLAEDIATINLYAEPAVIGLYERLGFQKVPLPPNDVTKHATDRLRGQMQSSNIEATRCNC